MIKSIQEKTKRSTIVFENEYTRDRFHKRVRWNIDYLIEFAMRESGIYPPNFKIDVLAFEEDKKIFDIYKLETGQIFPTQFAAFVSKKNSKIYLSTDTISSKKMVHEIVHVLCEKYFNGRMSVKTQHMICWHVERGL